MQHAHRIVDCTFLALWACNAHAQAPDLEWQRCLGGSSTEQAWGVQSTADGGYAVLGTTLSTDGDVTGNNGFRDFWLTRLDAEGSILWQRCYGGTSAESANALLANSDGGFLLLGSSGSTNGDVGCSNSATHAWALKVDPLGGIQWQVCLGSDPDGSGSAFYRAVETADGGYLAVGGTFASAGVWHENHGMRDYFAMKLDGTGQVQWLHCYGGSGYDVAFAVRPTADNGFVIAGVCDTPDGQITSGNQGTIWVIKVDADGNLLWNRRMGGSTGPQDARDIVMNPDGTILVVGSVGSNDGDISGNHGSYDVWLVLLDSGGTILDQRCFGGSYWDSAWGGIAANQGRYVIAGFTESNDGDVSGSHGDGGNSTDVWVFMVDADLNLMWQKCLGGTANEAAFAMARTPDAGTIVAGYTNSNDGDVSGLHPPGADDIWVAKLAPELDAGIRGPERADFAAFPSPASGFLNVRLPDALPAYASLDVLDINGRIVLHELLEGKPSIKQIDVAGWAAGVYCLLLDLGDGVSTTRFVKQ